IRSWGSHFFIAGVRTRLKKYSKPIQMMPKMRCSQRRTIISFAAAPPRKEKCGRHAGNEYRNRCRNMATPRNSGESFCGTTVTDCGANRQSGYAIMFREIGARERTRTSTTLRSLAPEANPGIQEVRKTLRIQGLRTTRLLV